MRCITVVSALSLIACATGQGGSEPQPGVRDVGVQPSGHTGIMEPRKANPGFYSPGPSHIYTAPDNAIVTTVPTPIENTFTNILSGYLGIGVRIMRSDPKAHVAGNEQVVAMKTFNGQAPSKLFNCGRDGVTGFPRADSYRIQFSIITSLVAVDSTTTRVSTFVTGDGQDPATTASPVHCTSTGALERALLRAAGYTADTH